MHPIGFQLWSAHPTGAAPAEPGSDLEHAVIDSRPAPTESDALEGRRSTAARPLLPALVRPPNYQPYLSFLSLQVADTVPLNYGVAISERDIAN